MFTTATTSATLWNLALASVTCLLAISGYSNALKSFSPFDDALTLNPHYGGSSQIVEHLGRMIKLRTFVAQYSIFPCTFTIKTRTRETEIAFQPDNYCFLGICGDYKFDLEKLAASGFKPDVRTIILVPGYMSGAKNEWIDEVASLWLNIEDVNVIKVSWMDGNRYRYEAAVSGTPIVAREITILLHHLAAMNGHEFTEPVFAKSIQIVGHSLGAHIGGFVGQDLGGRVGRITGLDPAGVFFDKQDRVQRLDPTDARLVDVIHTNGGTFHYHNLGASAVQAAFDLFLSKVPGVNRLHSNLKTTFGEGYSREANTSWFGIDQQVGHIDYYANNGRVQPGCDSYLHVCDHGRAVDIYKDFLAYEHDILRNHDQTRAKQNRLLTFKSDKYDSFFIGSNLAANCRPILDANSQSNDRRNLQESMKRCSLPMDLTGRVDDLIREYSNDYGVESFSRPTKLSQTRYYFSTRGQKRLVGNHFMLKIYPSGMLNYWNPSKCSLKVEINLPDGMGVTKFSMLQDEKKPVGLKSLIGGPLMFSALFTVPTSRPIIHPVSSSATNQSIDWQAEARQFLPPSIILSVSTAGLSHSAMQATARKIYSLFSVKSGLIKCNLFVQGIEIIPLIGSERAFVGKYENLGLGDKLSTDNDLQVRLYSVDT